MPANLNDLNKKGLPDQEKHLRKKESDFAMTIRCDTRAHFQDSGASQGAKWNSHFLCVFD
jgi:hypothetical protein